MKIDRITNALVEELETLHFGLPVTHVYNPLVYARENHDRYFHRYGKPPVGIVLLGMNPGPWGMAQTGVPFGEIDAVRGWLGIEADIGVPEREHPKRPVEGFSCKKSEVSGRRLWGWARKRFETPDRFFARFFVLNYCPLLFMEESGRNRTPDKLPVAERKALFEVCDRALFATISYLRPKMVVGVGGFAAKRATISLKDMNVHFGRITHPSPANPLANRGWEERVEGELAALQIP
jgi:single-strand selective monofunctional uracil DNA glycosylase